MIYSNWPSTRGDSLVMWDSLFACVTRLWSAYPVKLGSAMAHASPSHSVIPPLSNPVSKLLLIRHCCPLIPVPSPRALCCFTEKILSYLQY